MRIQKSYKETTAGVYCVIKFGLKLFEQCRF